MNEVISKVLRQFFAWTLLCSPVVLNAQISSGGQPVAWQDPVDLAAVQVVDLGAPDANLVKMVWEEAKEKKSTATDFSYGFQRFVQANVLTEGTWFNEQGTDICRLRLKSPDAVMISRRSTALRSSRTLPRHAARESASSACGEKLLLL